MEKLIHYLILSILAILFLLPLLWMLFASVDPGAIQALKMPEKITLDNFKSILSEAAILRSFLLE